MLIYIEPKTELKMKKEKELLIDEFTDLVGLMQKVVLEKFLKSGTFAGVFASYPSKEELKIRHAVVFISKKFTKNRLPMSDMGGFLGGLSSKSIKRSLKNHKKLVLTDDDYRKFVEDFTHQISCEKKLN